MSGYFDLLRASHPLKIGDVIDGKKVIQTHYIRRGEQDVPMCYLEGEARAREYSIATIPETR